MLSRTSRLTSPADFHTALRRGRRAGSRLLVVHLWSPAEALDGPSGADTPSDLGFSLSRAPRAGLVVSKAVGGATVRNRVKRRLRHLVREHLEHLPAGSLVVVRALPPAAEASYDELGHDLRRGLERVVRDRAVTAGPVR